MGGATFDVLAFIRINFPNGASREEALLEQMNAEYFLYELRLGMVVLA